MGYKQVWLAALVIYLSCHSVGYAIDGVGPAIMPETTKNTITPKSRASFGGQFRKIDLQAPQAQEHPADKGHPALPIGFSRRLDMLDTQDKTKSGQSWYRTANGGLATAFKINSPGAVEVRLGILVRKLPDSATLRFSQSETGEYVEIKGDAVNAALRRNFRAGETGAFAEVYWSPTIRGSSIMLEVELPPGMDEKSLEISIPRIQHHFISAKDAAANRSKSSGACEIDLNCDTPSVGYAVQNSVARMSFVKPSTGLSYLCTGTLLNTSVNNYTPYFLSANHCISSQSEASSLETYWFYRSSFCNSGTLSNGTVQLSGGATLLYNSNVTDTSFLLLNGTPPGGVTFAGWLSTLPSSNTSGFSIHSPNGDLQKISRGKVLDFHNCASGFNGSFTCTPSIDASTSDHFGVSWSSGVTEGGSSGGGFFNSTGQLFGTLHGGPSSCENPYGIDKYGRFDTPYHAALKQWLSPNGQTYSLSVGRSGTGSGTVSSSPAGINCGSTCSATFNSGTSVTLTATATSGTFTGWSGDCYGSSPTCTLSMNANKSSTAIFTANGGSGGSSAALTNGVPITGLSGNLNDTVHYYIDIPSGATNLLITTTGGTGDVDLYVKFDSQPTTSSYDCRSWAVNNTESCSFSTPSSGRHFVMLKGYKAYSGVTLTASFTPPSTPQGVLPGGTYVTATGSITNSTSTPLCAMVLINGAYTFSCSPVGQYSLTFPLDQNGRAVMFVFVSGLAPQTITLAPASTSISKSVVVGQAFGVPSPVVTLSSVTRNAARTTATLTGNVRTQGGIPLCAMVLANGQYMFSCAGQGAFDLTVPLAGDGSVTLFSFVDGMAPYQNTFTP